jgi:hypothetical protein
VRTFCKVSIVAAEAIELPGQHDIELLQAGVGQQLV